MPDSKSTTMTPNEVQLLANRLYARGVSKIGVDTAEQASDLRDKSSNSRALARTRSRCVDYRRLGPRASRTSYQRRGLKRAGAELTTST